LRYINGLEDDSRAPLKKKQIVMNTLKEKINELNTLVLSGKAMDAFEKFYHPDVVMQENETNPTVSKEANRKREVEFFNNITEFRGAAVKGVAFGEDISTVIWQYDYTHKEWGVRNYTQVSVQHWKDGLIIKEQFFYAN
jgi:hypothetical protein